MKPDTPLKAIACFDAVMRTGSATLAAQQLFVTPGAVGQQLRKLEVWLGEPLFVRSVRKLQPTEQALRYWEQVKPALEQIDQANALLRGRGAQQVSLSLPPAFASTWFAKRMPDLTRLYPALQLHLSAGAERVNVQAGNFDLAVRHFDGEDDSLVVQLLLPDEARVYCSPAYRDRFGLRELSDLPRATLLYTTSHAHWSRWLATVGMSFTSMSSGLRFDQSEMAIDAARRGQGLVLTSPWLIEEDVEGGKLVQLYPQVFMTGKGYYLVRSKSSACNEALLQLWEWLCAASHGDGLTALQ